MNRREFISATCLASVGSMGALNNTMANANDKEPEYYELRLYHTLLGSKKNVLNDFLRDATIPALNRLGIGPVGVFNVMYGQSSPTVYVLMPHKSLESVATVSAQLLDDAEFQKAGASFLNSPLSDPGFVRINSSLMKAFDDMPRLEVPPGTAENKPRIFELRTYESHSLIAAKKKIDMFNKGGEIQIFKNTGLQPVFFGETLVGPQIPNLMYMLAFDDMDMRNKSWDTFRKDPAWLKLRQNPIYKDTVSNISDIILRPASYSQI